VVHGISEKWKYEIVIIASLGRKNLLYHFVVFLLQECITSASESALMTTADVKVG
jgi:hypothetical protein